MGRIAIIFSGLPRRSIQNINRFNRFLNDTDNVDVFIHSWSDPKNRSYNSPNPLRLSEKSLPLQDVLIDWLYKPIARKKDKPESWELEGLRITDLALEKFHDYWGGYARGREYFKDHILSNNISMWRSIFLGYRIFDDYKQSNNLEYQYVLRMRFDVLPELNLPEILKLAEIDKVLIPETGHPIGMANDWFAVGTPKLMEIYTNMFAEFPEIFELVQKKYGAWCNEYGLSEHLARQKILVKTSNLKMSF